MSLFENPFASAKMQSRPGPNQGNQQAGNDPLDAGKGNTDPKSGITPNEKEETIVGGKGIDTTSDGDGHDSIMQFDKLWHDEPVDPKNPPKVDSGYLPAIDPKRLEDHVNTLDFTKSVTPEDLQNITAGGEKATQTFLQVLNKGLRQATLLSFNANRKMLESSLNTAAGKFSEGIPAHVKDVMVQNGLTSSNPMMQDARFSPVIEGVRKRFQDKYPKATPSQIEEATNKYLDTWIDDTVKSRESKNKKNDDPNATALDGMKGRATGDPSANFEEWFDS